MRKVWEFLYRLFMVIVCFFVCVVALVFVLPMLCVLKCITKIVDRIPVSSFHSAAQKVRRVFCRIMSDVPIESATQTTEQPAEGQPSPPPSSPEEALTA